MKPELSIIVPVYNVEKYLKQCLDSLLSQEYDSYEIILVDDGSEDKSSLICDEYAKRFPKVVVIHQANRGVSDARNRGILTARGKYIAFVDADDFVSPEMYKRLIEVLESSKSDIVCCEMDYYNETGSKIKGGNTSLPQSMTGKEFTAHIFDQPKTVTGRVYNKVYYRDKVIELFDESLHICEDLLFVVNYCIRCESASYVNEAYYHIRERDDSLSRSGRIAVEKGQEVRRKIISLLEKKDAALRDLAESDYLDSCILYMRDNDTLFRTYVRENMGKVLMNTKLSFKLKAAYLIKAYIG